ncbi:hypothetical protein [uncultured Ruminococcus sp.]|uniref:hypothetical protein n=1 Tax=uncultured Ruminococcus sp. TaxID=165186 RepID=UPI00262E6331|nr:hypothetical protein [uncultured Ruminococcus sp.]
MRNRMGLKLFLTLFTAFSASAVIMICSLGQSNREMRIENRTAAAESSRNTYPYTVREYSGRIGVFRTGKSEPYMYIDADMSLLPELDRRNLSEGISFLTEAELKSYIADITS